MAKAAPEKILLSRSVSLPVQGCLSHPIGEFFALLRGAWRLATDTANWASQTCARGDVIRTPAMTELPRYQALDLYALAFGRKVASQGRQMYGCSKCKAKWFPAKLDGWLTPAHGDKKGECPGSGKQAVALPRRELPAVEGQLGGWEGARQSVTGLFQRVQAKYARERGKIVWRRERRTPEFLYPYPFPVHQKAWAPFLTDRGQPAAALALPGGKVTVRLRGGEETEHARRVFARLVEGEVAQRELSVGRQKAPLGRAANCLALRERRPHDGCRQEYRIMLRMSYFEEAYAPQDGPLATCKTGSDPFLTLTLPGVESAVWHCPWVRMWTLEHRKFLDDFADDMKFEKRWPAHERNQMAHYRDRRVRRQADRMKSWRQQTAAQVVGWCVRRGVARLLWDDTDRSFAEEMPWFLLRQSVQQKCDEAGIALVTSGPALEEEGEGEIDAAG